MHTRLLTGLVLSTTLLSQTSFAEENLWVYAKGTDTRPAGSAEVKLSNIQRRGKNTGDYIFNDIHAEIEYGLTDKLTIGAAALIFDHDYSVTDPDMQPMFDTQGGAGGRFNDTQFGGYELGLKYNILSPYIGSSIGLSVGLAYEDRRRYRLDGAEIDQDSVVAKIYLQKDFMDDTLVTVLNIKTEFERRRSPGVLEEEFSLDIAAGISYRIAPKWFVGLEFRHQSDYLNPQEFDEAGNPDYDDKGFNTALKRSNFDLGDFRIGTQHQNGNYFGPTIHYATQNWWVTGGVLWQVFGGGSEFAYVSDNRSWDEHEKVHIGMFYGYEF